MCRSESDFPVFDDIRPVRSSGLSRKIELVAAVGKRPTAAPRPVGGRPRLGTFGSIDLFNQLGSVDIVADAVGYFSVL
jgi:hypothetical protein